MEIRPVEPDEYARLGALTVDAYGRLGHFEAEPEYEVELADVRSRAEAAATAVLVAVDGDEDDLLGGVTFVEGAASPFFEHDVPDAAAIRMLAVAPTARGRGIGEALTAACVGRARELGRAAVVLHSTAVMADAHRLYTRMGFRRDDKHDWSPAPGVELLAFRLDL